MGYLKITFGQYEEFLWRQVKVENRNSVVVQRLGLGAFTPWGPGLIPGSIPGYEIKIPKAMQHAQVGGTGGWEQQMVEGV